MIVSEARIAANRRNALKSTGPRTPEGKERSRANALKHGLCSKVVQPEDLDLVRQRCSDWFDSLNPQDPFQAWLVNEIAILSIRIDRCERMERCARDKVALRASLSWEDDRRFEVEVLGAKLASKPAETIEILRRNPQGCEWLMTRWAMLAHTADTNRSWNEEQTRLAFDLLATPTAFRDGRKPGASLDFDGHVVSLADDLAVVARREIGLLRERRDAVADLDEAERSLTESDLTNDSDPELRRLRRYETMLHGRLRWCLAQLKYEPPRVWTHPELRPQWEVEPIPTPKPEPKHEDEIAAEGWNPKLINPPFDLEPDEFPAPGQDVDISAILKSRKEKRFQKAEGRRDARRRKVEKLRA